MGATGAEGLQWASLIRQSPSPLAVISSFFSILLAFHNSRASFLQRLYLPPGGSKDA